MLRSYKTNISENIIYLQINKFKRSFYSSKFSLHFLTKEDEFQCYIGLHGIFGGNIVFGQVIGFSSAKYHPIHTSHTFPI